MKLRTLLTAGLAGLCLTAFSVTPESFQGKKFPAFRMTDTSGKTVTSASLRGKVVLVDFWATWCGPCKAAIPTLQKLHQKYAKQGLIVIGADTWEHGAEDQKNGARNYAKKNNVNYRMTLMNDKFAESLGIQGIPTMFIIDKKGVVQKVQVGFDDAEVPVLEKTVAGLLKK